MISRWAHTGTHQFRMATNKPISGFPLITGTDLEPSDLLVIVDVSNTSSSPTGTTSSVALSSVLNNPQNGIIAGILEPARSTSGLGKIVNTSQNGFVFQSTGGTLTDFIFLAFNGVQIAAMRASDSALIGGKLMGVSVAPTVVVGAGAGTGATVSVVGSDSSGTITLVTGTSTALGLLCTLTFSTPYGNGLTGTCNFGSGGGPNYPILATDTTSTTLAITGIGGSVITASATYKLNYQVIGYGN